MNLSRLGIILIGLQVLLTALIPVFSRLFERSCSWICIFSEEQSYFFLFNLPGMSITSIPFISEFIKNMGTLEQRLNGEITMFHYIALFLFSSFVYYFIGWIIEIILRKRFNKFEGNKFKYLTFVLFSTLVLIILFMIFAELFMRISNVVGQRIEQFQRCSNKDGFNTYQWKNLRFEFYCKNWQYNGSYRVYDNGVPDKEYTYKDGHLVCQKQYQCYIDLKQ